MDTLGLPEDEFDDLVSVRRRQQFLWACRLPKVWLNRALLHKRAADFLYERVFAASERELARVKLDFRRLGRFGLASGPLIGDELEDMLDQQLIAEYLLLMGYAIECLLKGFLLSSRPELVPDEKRMARSIAHHDLPKLCHECSVSVEEEELHLLKLMSRHIVWGKYTAPLKVQDMPSWIHPSDQEEMSLAVSNPFHERRVQVLLNGLFDRAYNLLYVQRKEEMRATERQEI